MTAFLVGVAGVLAAGFLVLLGIAAVVGMIFKDESYHDLNDDTHD